MVAERIPCLDAGRPPTPPPVFTTFAPGDDEGERDFIVFLRDRIQRIAREARSMDASRAAYWLRICDAWRKAIQDEIRVESLLSGTPGAPLGIAEDPYDLGVLRCEFGNPRCEEYRHLLSQIDEIVARCRALLREE